VLVRLLHVHLHESTCELLRFPGRRRLAGAQSHDYVLPASRLARVERDVLNDTVALVEDAENSDSLTHGRDTPLPVRSRPDLPSAR